MCVTEGASGLFGSEVPTLIFPGADVYLCLGPDISEYCRGNMEEASVRVAQNPARPCCGNDHST